MIPKLNMNTFLDGGGKAKDKNYPGRGQGDAVRTPQDGRSSTPLRARHTVKGVPRLTRDGSSPHSWRSGAVTKLEDGGSALDLPRRAEELSYVLGGNILQLQDVQGLRLKAIEMAERLLLMEEWYKRQLREHSAYIEYRLMQLGVPEGGGSGAQLTPTAADKLLVPQVIRGRQTSISRTTGLNRPTLTVGATTSGRQAASAATLHTPSSSVGNRRTPDSSCGRLSRRSYATPLRELPFSSQAVASRHTPIGRRSNKKEWLHSGGHSRKAGGERRKLRSAGMNIRVGSRGSSDTGADHLLDELFVRRRQRRSLSSSLSMKATGASHVSKQQRPASVRLGWMP
ncbi:hypothetical protein TraAM80_05043 [Trypanosoma rangeli]|uniref:Uncharacterized protein n=1 Tax=Trypanosoma rangeli TaxID=5698 RepID=A0A422NGY8_TRYRA|nr:uncharacterized protein TraAM80_05043 [Trypanosoma rangeli]RNF04709.1 hypothetical protein TraAM80_05043 [Trypanosoma rangeli]|eukprot:RNF04709.1 hypothetical protein TraAM80_05043 [Trypanosoma rangeli]